MEVDMGMYSGVTSRPRFGSIRAKTLSLQAALLGKHEAEYWSQRKV